MDLRAGRPPFLVCVGAGGVGKTTLAAALGLLSARAGHRTLVMTFDPSLRLKDALGVGAAAHGEEVAVPYDAPGSLHASLLDPRKTFDRLVARYAPDDATRDRILGNPYYDHLAGHLGGILEYMAVERLYEVARERRYDRVILDTPPTRQAIDFLEAPQRIVSFLDSGALKIALKPWFDEDGHLQPGGRRLGFIGRGLERFLDRVVGLQLLRDMSEFFRAFEPLFDGFRQRAQAVENLLASPDAHFLLVAGPGEARIPDTLFFARRLKAAGWRLGPLVVNRVHPRFDGGAEGSSAAERDGRQLFAWLGERHARGVDALRALLPPEQQLVALPLEPDEPTDLAALEAMGRRLQELLRSSATDR
ncbi:MAG: ArsA family ATPase [Acidobacteria bacterium]|nr:MAG: ArsA family ATPase [Acidobacteriota bacterium]